MSALSIPLSKDEVVDYPMKTIFPFNFTSGNGLISNNCLPSKAPFHTDSKGVKLPTFYSTPNPVINQISDDLWSQILSFLTLPEIFNNFKSTCKYFNRLVMTCIVNIQVSSKSIQRVNLSDFPNLQVLHIAHLNPIAFGCLKDSLRKCINLRKLTIEFSSIKKKDSVIIISELEHLRYFLELRVDCCNLSKASFTYLTKSLHKVPSLQGISFTDTGLSPDCAKSLMEVLPSCKNLRLIDLDCNQLGDDGICEIASKLVNCNLIESFSASSNEVGNLGCICFFKQLPMLKNLHYLDMSDNNIDQLSISNINPILSISPHLQCLDISGNLFVKGSKIFPDFNSIHNGTCLLKRKTFDKKTIKIHQTPRVLRLSSRPSCYSNIYSPDFSEENLSYFSDYQTYVDTGTDTLIKGHLKVNQAYDLTNNQYKIPSSSSGLRTMAIVNTENNFNDLLNSNGDKKPKITNHYNKDHFSESLLNCSCSQDDKSNSHTLSIKKLHKNCTFKRKRNLVSYSKTKLEKVIATKSDENFQDASQDAEDSSDETFSDKTESFDLSSKKLKHYSTYRNYQSSDSPSEYLSDSNNSSNYKLIYNKTYPSNKLNLVLPRKRVPQTRAHASSENESDLIALDSDFSLNEDEFEDADGDSDSEGHSNDESENDNGMNSQDMDIENIEDSSYEIYEKTDSFDTEDSEINDNFSSKDQNSAHTSECSDDNENNQHNDKHCNIDSSITDDLSSKD